ncbi:MAG: YlxR family protein [Vulcanimicrobiaceae bacterium]
MGAKTAADPIRQCVGCRCRRPQAELLRFVRLPAGWRRDPPGGHRGAGRGVYVCSGACLRLTAKNKRYPGLAAANVEEGL